MAGAALRPRSRRRAAAGSCCLLRQRQPRARARRRHQPASINAMLLASYIIINPWPCQQINTPVYNTIRKEKLNKKSNQNPGGTAWPAGIQEGHGMQRQRGRAGGRQGGKASLLGGGRMLPNTTRIHQICLPCKCMDRRMSQNKLLLPPAEPRVDREQSKLASIARCSARRPDLSGLKTKQLHAVLRDRRSAGPGDGRVSIALSRRAFA